MIPSFYKSESRDFTLLQGDCIGLLSSFEFKFDMICAEHFFELIFGISTLTFKTNTCYSKICSLELTCFFYLRNYWFSNIDWNCKAHSFSAVCLC